MLFTDRSKAALLLWIIYVISVLFCYASMHVCLLMSCLHILGKRLTSWLSFVMSYCDVLTFPLASWVRCGAWLYGFLIFATFSYFKHCKRISSLGTTTQLAIYQPTLMKHLKISCQKHNIVSSIVIQKVHVSCSFLHAHFFWKGIGCRFTLELPHRGNYNMYLQHMLLKIRKKTIWKFTFRNYHVHCLYLF